MKQTFDRQGYVVIPGFFTTDKVQELSREIERYIAEVVPRVPPGDVYLEDKNRPDTIKQLIRLHRYDSHFEKLLISDRFVKLAEVLLGGAVIGKNMQWFNKPTRGGRATPPHQDGYYFKLVPNEALTMWLALDEVTEKNGCVRYVAGSHLRGLRPHAKTDTLGFSQAITDYGPADKRSEVAVPAHPGDLLVHHSLTIHRADANTSESKRRAFGLIYYAANATEDVEGLRAYTHALNREMAIQGKI